MGVENKPMRSFWSRLGEILNDTLVPTRDLRVCAPVWQAEDVIVCVTTGWESVCSAPEKIESVIYTIYDKLFLLFDFGFHSTSRNLIMLIALAR